MATKERIQQAVDDAEWQKFRATLKGKSTEFKLERLSLYYDYGAHGAHFVKSDIDLADCDACIRIDNYIKALCRGGQLKAGASLTVMLDTNWSDDWIKR